MNKKYDIAIIGSGIGGLTIGSLLSKSKKVIVLEKNDFFGGYCSSFRKGGFKFEAAVQAINGLKKGSVIRGIFDTSGASKNIDFVQPKHLYRAIFPDYDISVPQGDIKKYRDILFSYFPKEKHGIVKLLDTMQHIYSEVNRFFKEKTLKKSPYLLKFYRKTFKELLDQCINDKRLKGIISQYWIYRGVPPSKASCVTFSYIWYDYTANGNYFPRGGMQNVINNLVDTIKKNGGNVLRNSRVSEIFLAGDAVSQIMVEGKGKVSAKTVVSNIDVFKTFDMLTNKTGYIEKYIENLKANTLSISTFKIYLGLGFDLKDHGMKDYEIFINPGYDVEAMYKSAINGIFDKAPYSITVYSNLSDSFCRPGNSVLSIGVLSGYEFWSKLSKAEYEKKKEEAADAIISKCCKFIPDFRNHIKTKVIATPLTMERYTGNSRGSVYGWNRKSFSEEVRFLNPTTPIKNLFLTSQWTKIGGGVTGVLISADRAHNLIKSGGGQ